MKLTTSKMVKSGGSWWRDRMVTLMVIPERTRRLYKLVIPLVVLKSGLLLFTLAAVFLLIVGLDYVRVLGRLTENKRLKGENFKLRQELQLIRNKVDSMEYTLERVRNYAKKLQMLTGQEEKVGGKEPKQLFQSPEQLPRSLSGDRRSDLWDREGRSPAAMDASLRVRLEKLRYLGQDTETGLAQLKLSLLNAKALADATPSIMPIAGYISSGFGYRHHPVDGSMRMHWGIDIVAEPGTPVRAAANGVVSSADLRQGYGKVIVIDHDFDIRTLYAHNDVLFVTAGTVVKRGQIIGLVGDTGNTTGPHCHFEIRKGDRAIDPRPFLVRAGY